MTGKQLKNSILQWAIQGKLVPQDPNDEPASVLLEKIRAEKARLVKEGKIKKDKKESIIYRGDDNSHYEKFADGTVVCIDDEIPFDVPKGWEWCRIGTLFAHNNGKQLNKGNSRGTMMEYITTSNLYWDGFILDNLKKMPFEDNEIERCQAIKGDLLVCEGGDVGRSCIWTYDRPIMLQNHIHKLRAYYPLCTNYFFYIFWLYNMAGIIGGKGIGIQGFSSKALHNTLVPLPPLCEQQRIVAKMQELLPVAELYDSAQSKLDNLNKDIKPLLRKSILQEAIQGRLVPQDPNDEPASVLLQRIKEEKLRLVKEGKLKKKDVVDSVIYKGDDNRYFEKIGKKVTCIDEDIPFEIPSGWVWCRINHIAISQLGKTLDKGKAEGKEYPYLCSINVQWDGINLSKVKTFLLKEGELERYKLNKGDLLVCEGGDYGRCSIWDSNAEMYYQNALHRIRFFGNISALFYKYVFEIYRSIGYVDGQGQTIKHFTYENMKSLLFPLPPIGEQLRIVIKIDEALAGIMSR